MHFTGTIKYNGNEPVSIDGVGSGPIEAFFNALSHVGITGYKFKNYAEHAISIGADAKACSYIELEAPDGKAVFGIGISHNINYASIKGILCAINRCQPNVVREPQQPIFEKKQ